MTDTPNDLGPDLQEATTRNRIARQVIAGFTTATPSEIWRYVAMALADTPALVAEITYLRNELDDGRMDWANMAAAALATVSAHRDGEHDPLSYLRDELAAQGYEHRGRS